MPPKGSSTRGKRKTLPPSESSESMDEQGPPRKSLRTSKRSAEGQEGMSLLQSWQNDDSESEDELGQASEGDIVPVAIKSSNAWTAKLNVSPDQRDGAAQEKSIQGQRKLTRKPSAPLRSILKNGGSKAVGDNDKQQETQNAKATSDGLINYLDAPVPSIENGQKIPSPLRPSTSSTDLHLALNGDVDELVQPQHARKEQADQTDPEPSPQTKLAVLEALIAELKQADRHSLSEQVQRLQAENAVLQAQQTETAAASQKVLQEKYDEAVAVHEDLKATAEKVTQAMLWCTKGHPAGGAEMDELRDRLRSSAE